ERKFYLYPHPSDRSLRARIEHIFNPEYAEALQGDTTTWSTDNTWHLVVASWGNDRIGLSVDGAPPTITRVPWLPGIPTGGGYLYVSGIGSPGFSTDELFIFNRPLANDEISWLYDTRTAQIESNLLDGGAAVTGQPNPAIVQFTTGDDSFRRCSPGVCAPF